MTFFYCLLIELNSTQTKSQPECWQQSLSSRGQCDPDLLCELTIIWLEILMVQRADNLSTPGHTRICLPVKWTNQCLTGRTVHVHWRKRRSNLLHRVQWLNQNLQNWWVLHWDMTVSVIANRDLVDVNLTFFICLFCFFIGDLWTWIATKGAVVTMQPNWPELYSGETVTLRCEIQGGDTKWEYEWMTTSSFKPPNQNEYTISSVSPSHIGDYWCKGRLERAQQNSTGWSISFKLTASYSKSDYITSTLKNSWKPWRLG